MSPYEVINGKEFAGKVCRFGEPVFGFSKVEGKGTARWSRMIFLGKSEPHDTYLLFDGRGLVLTRSIRRVDTNWKSHLKYYLNFTHWSWECKPGYGGRVLPTKATKTAIGASYSGPTGTIEPSPFVDEDAEAVKQKDLEKAREEEELSEMALHDRVAPKAIEIQEEPEVQIVEPSIEGGIFDDEGEMTVAHAPEPILQSQASASASAPAFPMDVPQVPDVGVEAPVTPRHSPTTRTHAVDSDDDHEAKRARVEYSSMIRAVKISNETYHTMDDYDSELRLDDHEVEDGWKDDDAGEISLGEIPKELWSDCPIDRQPEAPEPWIDRLADMVELVRLCGMNVLEEVTVEQLTKEEHLTTKFAYDDWRLKDFTSKDGTSYKRWLRRSRLVAREFSIWNAAVTPTHPLQAHISLTFCL